MRLDSQSSTGDSCWENELADPNAMNCVIDSCYFMSRTCNREVGMTDLIPSLKWKNVHDLPNLNAIATNAGLWYA